MNKRRVLALILVVVMFTVGLLYRYQNKVFAVTKEHIKKEIAKTRKDATETRTETSSHNNPTALLSGASPCEGQSSKLSSNPVWDPQRMSRYMSIVAEERVANLEHACSRLGMAGNFDTKALLKLPAYKRPRFYISKKHKALFCEIPKCGSTSWRRAIMMMDGVTNATVPEDISGEDAYKFGKVQRLWNNDDAEITVEDVDDVINNYYSVMTVREPLQRLVSAFKDKMLPSGSGGETYAKVSKQIHLQYMMERNATHESKDSSSEYATWPEFVRYVLDPEKKIMMDAHWALFTDICDPCKFQYRYIAKLETVSSDAEFISESLGYDLKPFFPDGREAKRGKKWDGYTIYYEQLDPDDVKKLYDVYATQYELFGYSKPPFVR